jgi:hypothetical protein
MCPPLHQISRPLVSRQTVSLRITAFSADSTGKELHKTTIRAATLWPFRMYFMHHIVPTARRAARH